MSEPTESESMEEDGFDAPRSNFEAQSELAFGCFFLIALCIAGVLVSLAVLS